MSRCSPPRAAWRSTPRCSRSWASSSPTLLLLFAWLRFLGRESWLSSAVIAVASTAVAYALFIIGLGVPLPHLIVF